MGMGRCASGGIRDWNTMLKEMEAALKPGGVLLTFGAGSLTMYDEFFEEITDVTEDGHENDPGRKFTWMNKVCHAMRTSMLVSLPGFHKEAVLDKRPMQERNPGTLDHPAHTVRWLREMDAWKEVGSRTYFTPIGPWEDNRASLLLSPFLLPRLTLPVVSPRDRYVAELQRTDFLQVASTFRPLLITHGHFEETVDKWIERSSDELRNLRKKQYVKVRLRGMIR
jgi:hypothetical protein